MAAPMKTIAQHFIMSTMADHITSGSCYYTTSGNDKTVTTGFHHSLVIGPGFPNYYASGSCYYTTSGNDATAITG